MEIITPGPNRYSFWMRKRKVSVLKRIGQLDNIAFLINLNHKSEIFDFLKEKYPNIEELKVYSIHDLSIISLLTLQDLIQMEHCTSCPGWFLQEEKASEWALTRAYWIILVSHSVSIPWKCLRN